MKKVLILAAALIMYATTSMFAIVPLNTDNATGEYEIEVVCPIAVNNQEAGSVELGIILPGQTRGDGFVPLDNPGIINFNVTGYYGQNFTLSSSTASGPIYGTYSGSPTSGAYVRINDLTWQETADGGSTWYTVIFGSQEYELFGSTGCDGLHQIRCRVDEVEASADANSGVWSFTVDLSAQYVLGA